MRAALASDVDISTLVFFLHSVGLYCMFLPSPVVLQGVIDFNHELSSPALPCHREYHQRYRRPELETFVLVVAGTCILFKPGTSQSTFAAPAVSLGRQALNRASTLCDVSQPAGLTLDLERFPRRKVSIIGFSSRLDPTLMTRIWHPMQRVRKIVQLLLALILLSKDSFLCTTATFWLP